MKKKERKEAIEEAYLGNEMMATTDKQLHVMVL